MAPDRHLSYDELSRKRERAAERVAARKRLRKRQENSKDPESTQVCL